MTGHDETAGLAGRVEELRGLVAALQGRVTHWDAKLREETGAVLSLRLDLKKLREEVDRLQAQASDQKAKNPPVPRWHDLDQAAEAAQLATLRDWVNGVLLVQYPDYEIPTCWEAHRTALWELGTLHAEWLRIYQDSAHGDQDGALMFHDRWLPGVIGRLRRAIPCDEAGCRATARPGTRNRGTFLSRP